MSSSGRRAAVAAAALKPFCWRAPERVTASFHCSHKWGIIVCKNASRNSICRFEGSSPLSAVIQKPWCLCTYTPHSSPPLLLSRNAFTCRLHTSKRSSFLLKQVKRHVWTTCSLAFTPSVSWSTLFTKASLVLFGFYSKILITFLNVWGCKSSGQLSPVWFYCFEWTSSQIWAIIICSVPSFIVGVTIKKRKKQQ